MRGLSHTIPGQTLRKMLLHISTCSDIHTHVHNGQMDKKVPIFGHAPLVTNTRSPWRDSRELYACARQTPRAGQGTRRSTACATTNGVST